jgi:hypothetical protein
MHGSVHLFVPRHGRRRLGDHGKSMLTATLYPSLSHPGKDGYQVLLGSCNELVSDFVAHEFACEPEVHPAATAKHMADVLGMNLVFVDSMFCDTVTCDTWWDLCYYKASETTRASLARVILG